MPAEVRIKICGLTRFEDAALASELGAWALGFIFAPESPRRIAPAQARAIIDALPPRAAGGPRKVGVFVNLALDDLVDRIEQSRVDTVQLHGEESPEYCAELSRRLPRIEWIKVFRPASAADLAALAHYPRGSRFLMDAAVPGMRGGSGVRADWTLAARAKVQVQGKLILAGGLHAQNLQAAGDAVRPYAFDLSSGVEDAPGIKSAEKLRALFHVAAKMAARREITEGARQGKPPEEIS